MVKKNDYLMALINKYPFISSGRKNYKEQNERIEKNIKLIKIFIKNNNKNK